MEIPSADIPKSAIHSKDRREALPPTTIAHRRAFELVYNLGKIAEADAAADATLALHDVYEELWAVALPKEESPGLTEFQEAAVPVARMFDVVDLSLASARILDDLATEIYGEQTAQSPQITPLTDRLHAAQHLPASVLDSFENVVSDILFDTGEVLESYAHALMELLKKEEATVEAYKVPHVNGALMESQWRDGTPRKARVELLLEVVRQSSFQGMPLVELGGLPIAKGLLRLMRAYRQWRTLSNERGVLDLADLPPASQATEAAPAPVEPNIPAIMQVAVQAKALQLEMAQLIELHTERSRQFRPSWSSIKDEVRSLDLALKRTPPVTNERQREREAFDQARRRLLGLVAIFAAETHRDPDRWQVELQESFASFFTFERAVSANISRGQRALRAANASADISTWQPVEPDMALLKKYWTAIEPLAKQHLPQPSREQKLAAIAAALEAFKAYRHELANPEQHLKTIATHLGGITILRPADPTSPRIELSSAQRRLAVRTMLDDVITNERLHENTRQRAEVLMRLLAAPNQPVQPPTAYPAYGELYYIPPSEEQVTPYFSVMLRSEIEDWILIESLSYGKASYVFPLRLIERQGGSLKDFLDTYNKAELVHQGGIQIRHTEGWTVDSHLREIRRRIATAIQGAYS